MNITLTDGTTALVLSPDLYWSDEMWASVEQSVQRSITGALIVSVAARIAGRPITLQPPDDTGGCLTGAMLAQLQTWAATPGQQLTLTLRGVAHTVIFRHQDGAIEAPPFAFFSDLDASDYYAATLRFMEI